MTRSVAKSPRVSYQCDVNIHSLVVENKKVRVTHYGAARGLLETDLVVLNHVQVTEITPELALLSKLPHPTKGKSFEPRQS
ncbi:hypothetical protein TNCV_52651 [Trichonephila clavipes]|nr:hypothetical protein TNCV_52651 [Trichonephila clavipes]